MHIWNKWLPLKWVLFLKYFKEFSGKESVYLGQVQIMPLNFEFLGGTMDRMLALNYAMTLL